MKNKRDTSAKRRAGIIAAYIVLGILITGAVSGILLRIAIHHIEDNPEYITNWLEDKFAARVRIEALSIDSRGRSFFFEIRGVDISAPDAEDKILTAKRAYIEMDWLDSLLNLGLQSKRIKIDRPFVALTHHINGNFSLGSLQAFAGLEGDRDGNPKALNWLLNQPNYDISELELNLYSERQQKSWSIKNARVLVYPDNGGRKLKLSSVFTGREQGNFTFLMNWRGDLATGKWQGRSYMKGERVPLDLFLHLLPNKFIAVQKSLVKTENHMLWDEGVLDRAFGEFVVSNSEAIQLESGKKILFKDDIRGKFVIRGEGITREGKIELDFPDTDEFTGFKLETHIWRKGKEFKFALDKFNLENIAYFVPFMANERLKRQIAGMKLKGKISGLRGFYPLDDPENGFRASFDISGLGFRRVGKVPGLNLLSGTFHIHGKNARARLESENLVLDFGSWFRAPILIGKITGEFNATLLANKQWAISAENVQAATPDAQAVVSGKAASISGFKRPVVELHANFSANAPARVPQYLPVKIMKPRVIAWFDQAFTGGRVENGKLYIHGDLNKYPFINPDNGLFMVDFDVSDGGLKFHPDWPRAYNLNGKVRFRRNGMNVQVKSGRILGFKLRDIDVSHNNFKSKTEYLIVKSKVQESLARMQKFIRKTPLDSIIGKSMSGVKLAGISNLELDMRFKLKRSKKKNIPKIKGKLHLLGNKADLGAINLRINKIKGTVEFSENSIQAKSLSAYSPDLGGNITADVTTARTLLKPNGQVKVKFNLRINGVNLVKYAEFILPDIKGESMVAGDIWFNKRGAHRLKLASMLEGISLYVPDLVTKKASSGLRFESKVSWGGRRDKVTADFRLGRKIYGKLEKARTAQQWVGGLSVDSENVTSDNNGIFISGNPDVITYGDWDKWLARKLKNAKPQGGSFKIRLKGKIGKFKLGNTVYTDMEADALHGNGLWKIEFKSPKTSGVLVVPDNEKKPLSVAVKKYRLNKSANNSGSNISKEFVGRAMILTIKELISDGRNLGSLGVQLKPHSTGVKLNNIRLISKSFDLRGSGDWKKTSNTTKLKLHLYSQGVGKLLHNFGYTGKIVRGKTSVSSNLYWKGTPSDFDLARISGNAKLAVTNGILHDIDASSGKVLGLLGIHTWPRRLSGNWSDLENKGLDFDWIKGDFTIKNGVASTKKTILKSTTSIVKFSGDMDIARQLFDLFVTVTPNLTNSLPIVGVLISGLPGAVAGGTLALADKVTKGKIDKAVRSKYTIKGKWENPRVQKIKRPQDKNNPANPIDKLTNLPIIDG